MPRTVSPVKTPSTIRRTFTPELPDRAPGVPTGAAGEVARAAGGALAADPTGSGPVFAPQFAQNLAIRPPPAPSSMGELVRYCTPVAGQKKAYLCNPSPLECGVPLQPL